MSDPQDSVEDRAADSGDADSSRSESVAKSEPRAKSEAEAGAATRRAPPSLAAIVMALAAAVLVVVFALSAGKRDAEIAHLARIEKKLDELGEAKQEHAARLDNLGRRVVELERARSRGDRAHERVQRQASQDQLELDAGPDGAKAFDRREALTALRQVGERVEDCRRVGGPTGRGSVEISFAPSGKVTAAKLDTPPFAKTAVGSCIEKLYRTTRIPPYVGSEMVVTVAFVLTP